MMSWCHAHALGGHKETETALSQSAKCKPGMWRKRLWSFELTAVHSFLVLRMLYSQMGMQSAENPILWRQFLISSWEMIPSAPHFLVGSVRFCLMYTPRSWNNPSVSYFDQTPNRKMKIEMIDLNQSEVFTESSWINLLKPLVGKSITNLG